jgi:hypothetical protein
MENDFGKQAFLGGIFFFILLLVSFFDENFIFISKFE